MLTPCFELTLGMLVQVGAGNLERSYRRAPKGAGDVGGAAEAEGAGICHLCCCGQEVPWENLPLALNHN